MFQTKPKLCTQCLTQAVPKLYTKGNIGTEIVLWLLFILPGVLYSVWRHASRYHGCPSCGSADVIPLNSPRARQLLEEIGTPASFPRVDPPRPAGPSTVR